MLTAEKTHLLLTREDGRSESPSHHGVALAAAALADYRAAGIVTVEDAPVDRARVLDTLVDAGVARSRSDALAWSVRLVGEHADEWLGQLRDAMAEVDKLRGEGPVL